MQNPWPRGELDDLEAATAAKTNTTGQWVRELTLHRESTTGLCDYGVTKRARLCTTSDRDLLVMSARVMKLALAVYGSMVYQFYHPCSALCCLVRLSCTVKKRVPAKRDPCACNRVALVRLAEIEDPNDILYTSFHQGIGMNPYVIILDRVQKVIVVVVRGTMSLEDTVTDLNVKPQAVNEYAKECPAFAGDDLKDDYCHSGMLQNTMGIYRDVVCYSTSIC